ncbi:unnamed protein product [Caenorhabditis brenneri]
MVSLRKFRSESSNGEDSEASIDPEVQQIFEEFDTISFPSMDFEPVPEKTLKERILEQHRIRVEAIKAHEKKFSTESYVPDVIFFRRNDRDFDAYEEDTAIRSNIFREDEESFERVDDPVPYVNVPNNSESNFEELHEQRRKVQWNKTTHEGFERNNVILNRALTEKKISRIPNAKRRFDKLARVDLRLERLDQEEAEELGLDSEEEDPFGHFHLLPQTFTKSEKDPNERKRDVFERYIDLLHDFDYANRSGNKEKKEFALLQERKNDLELFLQHPSLERIPNGSPFASRTKFRVSDASDSAHSLDHSLDDVPSTSTCMSRNEETGYVSDSFASDEPPTSCISLTTQQSYDDDDNDVSIEIIEPPYSVNPVPIAQKETLKRKIVDGSDSEVVPKKIDQDYRLSSESVKRLSSEDPEKFRKIDQNLELARKEREQRKEATRKAEEEALEKQRKEKEYQEFLEKKRAEEKEEADKLRAQMQRDAEKAEKLRIEAEKKKKAEEEERRKKEEEERERRKKEEHEHEILRLQEEIQRQQRVVNMQVAAAVPVDPKPVKNPVKLSDKWIFTKCKVPEERMKQRKEKFFSHFQWLPDEVHRQLEKAAEWTRFVEMAHTKVIIIPQENNAKTRVSSLTRPIRALIAPPPPPPVVPSKPELIIARCEDIEKVLREVNMLLAPTRKALAARIPVYEKEIDYQQCYLDKLKMCITYPFKQSDGMYWPLFFALKDTSVASHVSALTKCLSFSGKFASITLLTASLEDEGRKNPQKFESSYAESAGDWQEYSQKPGRFSNRIGFKAHRNKCKDAFDIQRGRAKKRMATQFAEEKEEYQKFGNSFNEYKERNDRNKYSQNLTIHLRTLVKDARLDVYSLRETFKEFGVLDHPGTRDSPLEIWWYAHGYRIFLETRDREYGHLMSDVCNRYERMLPMRYDRDSYDRFNEWCFQPMLASLYYQLKYKPFDVFSRKDMSKQFERHRRYTAFLKDKKFDLKAALEICRLTDFDKRQWTILNDQLAAQFKDFPAIFSLMFDPNCDLIRKTDRITHDLMRTVYRDRENSWDLTKSTNRYSHR